MADHKRYCSLVIFYYGFSDSCTGCWVLSSYKMSIDNYVLLPVASFTVFSPILPELGLEQKRNAFVHLNLFLFIIRKRSQFLTLDKCLSSGKLEVHKCSRPMTDTRDYSSLFVYHTCDFVKFLVLGKIKNSSMASCEINAIVLFSLHIRWFMGVGDKAPKIQIRV